MSEELDQPRLVVVVDDARDVGQRAHFVRPARRVAAGDDDARGRIVAGDAADGLARALIGGRRHGTAVDDKRKFKIYSRTTK